MQDDEVDALVARANAGEPGARDALFATAYPALRELARARLRDGGGHAGGLNTTQLVHESYLRLASSTRLRAESRREFFAYAARVMREFIVDTLRRPRADDAMTLDTQAEIGLPSDAGEVLRVHEALGLTERTVRRDWDKARLMLLALLR